MCLGCDRANGKESQIKILMNSSLRVLYNYGYQPMYNGRPSCPFCNNFVDEEETHSKNCLLHKFIEEDNESR